MGLLSTALGSRQGLHTLSSLSTTQYGQSILAEAHQQFAGVLMSQTQTSMLTWWCSAGADRSDKLC